MQPLHELIQLTDKVAIVTGGAVGIGLGISKRLLEAGAKVVVADVSDENLESARKELAQYGDGVAYTTTDVSSAKDVDDMVAAAIAQFGGVDILVNNAGIYPNMLVMNMKEKDFERVIDVNLKGVFLTTQRVANHMIEQKKEGRIINVTSIDALHPSSAGLAHYDSSKHGVWGFTKNVAIELAPHKIWVNAVAPGGIITPGVQNAQAATKMPEGVDMNKVMESFLARIPMHRMGEPDDIAKAVLYLATGLSSYATGTQIVVDGGVLLS